jgi:hypothetical protein
MLPRIPASIEAKSSLDQLRVLALIFDLDFVSDVPAKAISYERCIRR